MCVLIVARATLLTNGEGDMACKKKHILIVDDDHINAQILESLLLEYGYQVSISLDGNSALDFLDNNNTDLILLDIMMPGMDGYEICKILKSRTHTKHIPVIFLTAKTKVENIIKGFEVGGVDYVSKPFHSEELIARVKTHIEIKMLRGLLPICASCKSIRNDEGYWQSVEEYFESHNVTEFSHTVCDKCAEKLYGEEKWFKLRKKK